MSPPVRIVGAVTAALFLGLAPAPSMAQGPPVPSPSLLGQIAPAVSPLQAPDLTEDIATGADLSRRMSVPVKINGRGPFNFIVDTGADHSVISEELAASLGLERGAPHLIHGVAGDRMAGGAKVALLEVGTRRMEREDLSTLPRASLGTDGILGLDALGAQKVVLDFGRGVMSVEGSKGFKEEPDAVVVRAKRRFGHLVLIDSSVRKTPIYVILDSGAQDTIANTALLKLIARRRADDSKATRVGILSVTGQVAEGFTDELPELTLGGVAMRRVPVIRADVATFRQFDLKDEPAMLLGVDVMRAFKKVQVDFKRREVSFGINRDVSLTAQGPRGMSHAVTPSW